MSTAVEATACRNCCSYLAMEMVRFSSLTPNGGETRMRSAEGDSASSFLEDFDSRTSRGSACFSTRAGLDPARRFSGYQTSNLNTVTPSFNCLLPLARVLVLGGDSKVLLWT